MTEPALPVPPLSFDEPAAIVARRRPLGVTPRHVRLEVHVAHALGIQVVPLAVAVLHDFDRCPECFGPLDPHGPNAVTA